MLQTADQILKVSRPSELFKMELSSIESERDKYLEKFKPSNYNTLEHFLVTQRVTLMYRQAIEELQDRDSNVQDNGTSIILTSDTGEIFKYIYTKFCKFELGNMYIGNKYVVYIVGSKYEDYYKNYIQKTSNYSKLDKKIWSTIEYMLPDVAMHFKCKDGSFAIVLNKSETMYSMREILDYFGGKLDPRHVSSILTRLYYFMCYMDIIGMTHNGITVDNIFFAPGRFIEENETVSKNDMRIVGVLGGWFFSTWDGEKIKGMPKKVYSVASNENLLYDCSNYKVDAISIKSVAKELIGSNEDIPNPLVRWLSEEKVKSTAYDEANNWHKVMVESFGNHRFVSMDISI